MPESITVLTTRLDRSSSKKSRTRSGHSIQLTRVVNKPTTIFIIVFVTFITILKRNNLISLKSSKHHPIALPHAHSDVTRILSKLLQQLEYLPWTNKENILDYSSGREKAGYEVLLPIIKKYNSHLYAVDPLKDDSDYAKSRYADSSITFGVGGLLDEQTLPFPDKIYDKILALNVFHQISKLEELFEKFSGILISEGVVGFTTLTDTNPATQVELALSQLPKWNEYMADYKDKYYPLWTTRMRNSVIPSDKDSTKTDQLVRGFEQAMETAGFNVIHMEVRAERVFCRSVDSQIDQQILHLSPAFSRIPKDMIPTLKTDMRQYFSSITGVELDAVNFHLEYEYIFGIVQRVK